MGEAHSDNISGSPRQASCLSSTTAPLFRNGESKRSGPQPKPETCLRWASSCSGVEPSTVRRHSSQESAAAITTQQSGRWQLTSRRSRIDAVLNALICDAVVGHISREHTPSRAERRTIEPAQPDQGAAVWPDSKIKVFVRFHKKISHIQQDTGFNDEPPS